MAKQIESGPYSWEHATIPEYKPLVSTDGWLMCPACHEYPRTWVFDNGNFAKCRCHYKYNGAVRAQSIIEACHYGGMPYDQYLGLLKAAWNQHVAERLDNGQAETTIEAVPAMRQQASDPRRAVLHRLPEGSARRNGLGWIPDADEGGAVQRRAWP